MLSDKSSWLPQGAPVYTADSAVRPLEFLVLYERTPHRELAELLINEIERGQGVDMCTPV
jgi:hypothetical protein